MESGWTLVDWWNTIPRCGICHEVIDCADSLAILLTLSFSAIWYKRQVLLSGRVTDL